MVTEAPHMRGSFIETALNAQIAVLQRRNVWLERQVALEAARVPQSYVGRDLGGKSLEELTQLSPQKQADLLRSVAGTLKRASVTEERPLAPSIPIHNLEWNGELPHPTWAEVKVGYRTIERNLAIKMNKKATESGFWTTISAIRHDGSMDHFSVSYINLGDFKVDLSTIVAAAPNKYGEIPKDASAADPQRVAELFDFTRGVRGGLKVVGRQSVTRPSSDD